MKVFTNQATIPMYSAGLIVVAAEDKNQADILIMEYCHENYWRDDTFNLDYTIQSGTLQTNVEEAGVLYAVLYEE